LSNDLRNYKVVQKKLKFAKKKEFGIPEHVWKQIPDELKPTWKMKG
jgi:hypothetical protein